MVYGLPSSWGLSVVNKVLKQHRGEITNLNVVETHQCYSWYHYAKIHRICLYITSGSDCLYAMDYGLPSTWSPSVINEVPWSFLKQAYVKISLDFNCDPISICWILKTSSVGQLSAGDEPVLHQITTHIQIRGSSVFTDVGPTMCLYCQLCCPFDLILQPLHNSPMNMT